MLDKMTEDVAVHQTLGDEPNAENGLTADDLKRLFDRPATLLKTFLNENLIPFAMDKRGDKLEGDLDLSGFFLVGVPTPILDGHAASKGYVDGRIRFCEDGNAPDQLEDGMILLFPEEA